MVFCVSVAPLLRLYGTSPDGVRRIFSELADVGIGGIWVEYRALEIEPDWVKRVNVIAQNAREFGFRMCAHAPGGDISATDPTTREHAVDTVRGAITALGSHLPGVVIAVHPEDYAPVRQPGDDEPRMECCRRSLKTLAETASALGARIALENMRWRPDAPNRTGMFVDQLSEIIADTDPATVGICFDTGHANISEKTSPADAFKRNAARIIHVHLDDNHGVDDEHLPPGEGNIDFEGLFRAVKDAGYDDMVELEVKMPEGEDPFAFYRRNYKYYLRMGGQGR